MDAATTASPTPHVRRLRFVQTFGTSPKPSHHRQTTERVASIEEGMAKFLEPPASNCYMRSLDEIRTNVNTGREYWHTVKRKRIE